MDRKNLIIFVTLFPMLLIADEPNWAINANNDNTASACVNTNGNLSQAKVIAKAVATGRLSESLGGKVSAKSELITTIKESSNSLSKEDTLNETITIQSDHYLSNLEVVKSGEFDVNGQLKHCVLMKMSR